MVGLGGQHIVSDLQTYQSDIASVVNDKRQSEKEKNPVWVQSCAGPVRDLGTTSEVWDRQEKEARKCMMKGLGNVPSLFMSTGLLP